MWWPSGARLAGLPALIALLAADGDAQGSTVSGVVRDTIARAPLPSAWVQLVSRESDLRFARTVQADSLGRYAIADVPAGRYALWFFHPRLDSLGVTAPVRDVRVGARRTVRADLATPTASMLRAAICDEGRVRRDAPGALLIGVVRDARNGTPIPAATIVSEWVEFTIGRGAELQRRQPRLEATSGTAGVFAICDVPNAGSIFVRASHGADSTDLVELHPAGQGLVRRDLFLGAVQGPASYLRGVVTAADSIRPLANASVRIVDGPVTRTNERGEWVLTEAPGGTRTLEVRAIGFYPQRRAVDVVTGAPVTRIEMLTFQAMLDTVRVVASRVTDRSEGGFDRRRRATLGTFLTEEQIARQDRVATSDLFRMVTSVRIERTEFERGISIRGPVGERCTPAFFIDGLYMFTLSADELDGIVSPREIRGIEIYAGASTPAQFQPALSGCGAIVIWTKGAPAGLP